MNCPTCGLSLQGVTSATCPRCGQPIPTANPYGPPPSFYPPTPAGYGEPQPGYGQPAPMGYEQPGYGPPPGYGAPAGYGMPVPPPPPAPKRRVSRGVVRLVSVIAVVACIGILALVGALGNHVTQSPLPGVTATVTGKWIYRQSFTTSTDSMPTDSNCNFANGGYQIQNGLNCYPDLGDQTNATITVQVKQTSGDATSFYGIDFRRASKGNFYTFRIDSSGDWIAGKFVNSTPTELGSGGQSQAIQTGANTVNTLQVHMSGSHFDFYVNGTMVGSADDSTFAKGKSGLGVESNIICVFNNMEVTI